MVAQHGVKQQNPSMEELKETASNLVVKGKGLLASDESVGTIGKRIEKAGLANTQVTHASSAGQPSRTSASLCLDQ